MYRNSYQRGMLTVFFSVGSKPLAIWDVHIQDGYVTRFLDQDIKSMVLEIGGTNVSTTYITCPKDNKVLGITMPFLVMIVKNLKKYFSFEVTILDETGTRRRFRVSNFQSSTQILPLCTVMPIGLSDGWNQIQFNLAEFTRRAYKKQYVEVQKLKVNANIRLRRIYFTERLLPEDELPNEYKLFFPLSSKAAKDKKTIQATAQYKENIQPSTSQKLIEEPMLLDEKVEMKSSKMSVHSMKKQPSQVYKKESKTEVESVKEILETAKEISETTEGLEGEEREFTIDAEEKIEGQEVKEDIAETDAAEIIPTETAGVETEIAGAEITPTEITGVETEIAGAEIPPEQTEVAPSESDAVETVPTESSATEVPVT
ncbi:cilia- and flagella-associated protein 20-like [Maniola jurtina]|uniref:cilia- and flagella-associated protein 20-like n=1 Tax=Maniola jurtina TaxID=191418 RepID=UPI001E687D10|nr:cilia- and flagella-associated protein 20-like [Maniola jurtina]